MHYSVKNTDFRCGFVFVLRVHFLENNIFAHFPVSLPPVLDWRWSRTAGQAAGKVAQSACHRDGRQSLLRSARAVFGLRSGCVSSRGWRSSGGCVVLPERHSNGASSSGRSGRTSWCRSGPEWRRPWRLVVRGSWWRAMAVVGAAWRCRSDDRDIAGWWRWGRDWAKRDAWLTGSNWSCLAPRPGLFRNAAHREPCDWLLCARALRNGGRDAPRAISGQNGL